MCTWAGIFSRATVFGLPVSGGYFAPYLMASQVSGDPLFTGGAFGTEGSLLTAGVNLAFIAVLYAWGKRQTVVAKVSG